MKVNSIEFLKITFTIILLVIVIIIIYNRLSNKVKKTSIKYKETIALNKQYESEFDNSVLDKYTYKEELSSKQKFDRFNFDSLLSDKITFLGINYWNDLYRRTQHNDTLYMQYKQEVSQLLAEDNTGNSHRKQLFSRIYHKFELKMCEKNMLKEPTTLLVIVCHINYTSPAGRNSYNNCRVYHYNDILRCYEKIKQQEEKRSTKEYQRSAMTRSLRYDIMKRDGFKCVLCGQSATDGVKLHVDHIFPVSKGGKTVKSNLRTLCEECNMGKRDKYDFHGIN